MRNLATAKITPIIIVQQKKVKILTTKLLDGCLLIDFVLALSWDLGLETYSATNKQQGVCHTVAFAIYIQKNILRQNKNYENSNISPCNNIIFKKSSKRNQSPSTYYNYN
jgi:hypothetical protein